MNRKEQILKEVFDKCVNDNPEYDWATWEEMKDTPELQLCYEAMQTYADEERKASYNQALEDAVKRKEWYSIYNPETDMIIDVCAVSVESIHNLKK